LPFVLLRCHQPQDHFTYCICCNCVGWGRARLIRCSGLCGTASAAQHRHPWESDASRLPRLGSYFLGNASWGFRSHRELPCAALLLVSVCHDKSSHRAFISCDSSQDSLNLPYINEA
jgi:hypothetical protein